MTTKNIAKMRHSSAPAQIFAQTWHARFYITIESLKSLGDLAGNLDQPL